MAGPRQEGASSLRNWNTERMKFFDEVIVYLLPTNEEENITRSCQLVVLQVSKEAGSFRRLRSSARAWGKAWSQRKRTIRNTKRGISIGSFGRRQLQDLVLTTRVIVIIIISRDLSTFRGIIEFPDDINGIRPQCPIP